MCCSAVEAGRGMEPHMPSSRGLGCAAAFGDVVASCLARSSCIAISGSSGRMVRWVVAWTTLRGAGTGTRAGCVDGAGGVGEGRGHGFFAS
jgi:hypothetical protein